MNKLKTTEAKVLWKLRCKLGEGTLWVKEHNSIYFVDIKKKSFFSLNTKNNWDQLLQQGLNNRQDVTDSLSKMFFEYYLSNDILTKVDRASMYNGLEVRSPFLSKSLIEFSYQLSNKSVH